MRGDALRTHIYGIWYQMDPSTHKRPQDYYHLSSTILHHLLPTYITFFLSVLIYSSPIRRKRTKTRRKYPGDKQIEGRERKREIVTKKLSPQTEGIRESYSETLHRALFIFLCCSEIPRLSSKLGEFLFSQQLRALKLFHLHTLYFTKRNKY